MQRALEVSNEKGASSWLSALPIAEHGFALHKGAFRDAMCLRYGRRPPLLPANCVCGVHLTIEHALSCPRGGFPSIRHNELRDITETCHSVGVEPPLQPLGDEQLRHRTANREDGARLDIVAENFWGRDRQNAFFDVRVFNPYARSHRGTTLAQCYRKNEQEKKRTYEERILKYVLMYLLSVHIEDKIKQKTSVKFAAMARENVTKHLNEFDQMIAEVDTLFQELPELDPKAVDKLKHSIYEKTGVDQYRRGLVEKEKELVDQAAAKSFKGHVSPVTLEADLTNTLKVHFPAWEKSRDDTIKALTSLADDIDKQPGVTKTMRCDDVNRLLAKDKMMTEALLKGIHGIEVVSRKTKVPILSPAVVSIQNMIVPVKEMASGSKGKSTGGSQSNSAGNVRRLAGSLDSSKKSLQKTRKELDDRLRTRMKKRKEGQVLGWRAAFRAVTFNTCGKSKEAAFREVTFNVRGAITQKKPFLRHIMDDLSCDVYLMQECEYSDNDSWGKLFPLNEFHVNVTPNREKDAGMAWKAETIYGSNFAAYSGRQVSLQNRFAEIRYEVVNTQEVVMLSDGRQSIRQSRKRLSFLAFSFHGRYKVKDVEKRAQILAFFTHVIRRCTEEKLPALVGGDFNYNLSRGDISVLNCEDIDYDAGYVRRPDNEIDYICSVSPTAVRTKLSFHTVPETWDIHQMADIARPRVPRDDITNHWPYSVSIFICEESP